VADINPERPAEITGICIKRYHAPAPRSRALSPYAGVGEDSKKRLRQLHAQGDPCCWPTAERPSGAW
jgi:hypothetical protein